MVGIGNVPDTGLAEAPGLLIHNGIVVSASGQTSDPDTFAAGDVTNQPCHRSGGRVRRESWANAQNQAIVAAKAATGQPARYTELPWLWSDQHGANIQVLGDPMEAIGLLLREDKAGGTRIWLALDQNGLAIGAVAVNAPRELRAARKLIAAGQPVDPTGWMVIR